jgi:hypothetical protein
VKTIENFSHSNRTYRTHHTVPTHHMFLEWIEWKHYKVPKNRNFGERFAKKGRFSHPPPPYPPVVPASGPPTQPPEPHACQKKKRFGLLASMALRGLGVGEWGSVTHGEEERGAATSGGQPLELVAWRRLASSARCRRTDGEECRRGISPVAGGRPRPCRDLGGGTAEANPGWVARRVTAPPRREAAAPVRPVPAQGNMPAAALTSVVETSICTSCFRQFRVVWPRSPSRSSAHNAALPAHARRRVPTITAAFLTPSVLPLLSIPLPAAMAQCHPPRP